MRPCILFSVSARRQQFSAAIPMPSVSSISRAWQALRTQSIVRRTAGISEFAHSVRSRLGGTPSPPGRIWTDVSIEELAGRPLRRLCILPTATNRLDTHDANDLLDGILMREVRGVSMLAWHGPRPQDNPLARIREGAVASDLRASWEEHRLQHFPIAVLLGHRCDRRGEVADFLDQSLSAAFDAFSRTPGSLIPMEVGLRIVSLCLTADLSAAAGIDRSFVNGKGMQAHLAKHVITLRDHWEWRPRVRSNHYLANVVGLIWGAAYLDLGAEALRPLCEELYGEGCRQILPDGGSFEGTTSYLRLSLEMIATTLLLLRRANTTAASGHGPIPRAPAMLDDRLRSAREFLSAIDVGAGSLLQIGDCDSGRCGPLMIERLSYDAEAGSGRALAVEALATRECMDLVDGALSTARRDPTVRSLRDLLPQGIGDAAVAHAIPQRRAPTRSDPSAAPDQTIIHRIRIDLDSQEVRDGRTWLFEHFGLWVFQSKNLLVALRTGATGNGITGAWHSHTDVLSMQLVLRGTPLLTDAGTFIYLGDRDARELFRSSRAHNSPCWPEDETMIIAGGPFRWISAVRAHVTCVEQDRCAAIMTGPYGTVGRQVTVTGSTVEVTDRLWRSRRGQRLSLSGVLRPSMPFSPAYGEIS